MKFNIKQLYRSGGMVPMAMNPQMARKGLKDNRYNAMMFPGNGTGVNPMTMSGMKDDVQYFGLSNNGQVVDSGMAYAGQPRFNVKGDKVLEYRVPKSNMPRKKKFQNSGYSNEAYNYWRNQDNNPDFDFNNLAPESRADYEAYMDERNKREPGFMLRTAKEAPSNFGNYDFTHGVYQLPSIQKLQQFNDIMNLGFEPQEAFPMPNSGQNLTQIATNANMAGVQGGAAALAKSQPDNKGKNTSTAKTTTSPTTTTSKSGGIPIDYDYSDNNMGSVSDFKQSAPNNNSRAGSSITSTGTTPNTFDRTPKLTYTDGQWKKLPGGTDFRTYNPAQARISGTKNALSQVRSDIDNNFKIRDERFKNANERQQRRREQLKEEASKIKGLRKGIRDSRFDKRTDKIEANKQRKIARLEGRLENSQSEEAYNKRFLKARNAYQVDRINDQRDATGVKIAQRYNQAAGKFDRKLQDKQRGYVKPKSEPKMTKEQLRTRNNVMNQVFANGGYNLPKAQFGNYGRPANPSFTGPDRFQLQEFNLPKTTDRRMMASMNTHGGGLPAGMDLGQAGAAGIDPSFTMNFNEGKGNLFNTQLPSSTVQNFDTSIPSNTSPSTVLSGAGLKNNTGVKRPFGLDRGTNMQLAGEFLPAFYNMGQSFIPAKKEKPLYNKHDYDTLHKMEQRRIRPDMTRIDASHNAAQKALRNSSSNPAAIRANQLALANNRQSQLGSMELKVQQANEALADRALQFRYGIGAARAAEDKRVNQINNANELSRQNLQDLSMTQFGTGMVDLGKHLSNYDMNKFEWETLSQIYDQYGLAAFDDLMSGKVTPQEMIQYRNQEKIG